MSNHHLSRRDAERIVGAPAESDHPVGPALEALRAPGSASELLREDATVAAFHAARLGPASISRRSRTLVPPRSAAARAVAATGLVVALSTGGFALAASDHLPALPGRPADQASTRATDPVAPRTSAPAGSPTATPPTAAVPTTAASDAEADAVVEAETVSDEGLEIADETTEEGTGDGREEDAEEDAEGASAVPTPDLEGLCNAFQAHDKSLHGAALDSAAFTALATAAGGKDAVAAYCVTLVGAPEATGTPASPPTQAAHPGSGRPSTHPAPMTEPSPKPTPTTKPTAQPAPKPTTPTGTGKPTTPPSPDDGDQPEDSGQPDHAGKPDTTGTH
jgi:hypothetical protein